MAVFECRPWLGSFSGVGGAWKQLYDKTNPREDPQYTKDVLDWTKVRKTRRADCSLLLLYSHRNARASLYLLGQSNMFLAEAGAG